MIDGLIAGKIYGQPKQGTGKNGSIYVSAKVKAAGGDGELIFVNVIAFADDARFALMALDDGDSVSLSGSLTPRVWTDREGVTHPSLDMQAHAVLTTYHAQRKRKAVQGCDRPQQDQD
jgi:single-stranded DNA-binding protein